MQTTAELTGRQREIWSFLVGYVDRHGYPPTVREIGEAVGLASPSTVHAHLANLERAGLLKRDPTKPRAIELTGRRRFEAGPVATVRDPYALPLLGRIAAGGPLLAEEAIEETISVPEPLGRDADFLLRITGESMIEAGILDGDYVVVRQQPEVERGEIVAAGLPDGDATVKFFSRRGRKVVLRPANPDFEPIEMDAAEVTVYGKVVTVLRRL